VTDAPELLDVMLIDLPVEDFRRSQQHHDALLREFALVDAGVATNTDTVPRRVLDLVRQLRQRFGSFSAEPETRLREAIQRNDTSIDIHFRVPVAARHAAIELGRLLEEADEYCRQGALLTLAAPPDVRAFRNRYLEEFVRQIDGAPPRSWREA
jgi:hypothetical protein